MDNLDRLGLETEALKAQMSELDRMAESLGNRLVTAFAGAALQGRNLEDVLRGLALSLSRMALSQALKPLGGLIANSIGKVTPFADGGIVNGTAEGVAENGALLLATQSGQFRFHSGEVSLRAAA